MPTSSTKHSTQSTRLRYLRQQANLSTREVGEYIGRSNSQITRYETVATADIRDVVDKLAKLYKVTADFILYGENGPPAHVLEMRRQVAQLGVTPTAPVIRMRAGDVEVVFARRVPVAARATFAENLADGIDGMDDYEEVVLQNPTAEMRRPGLLEVVVNGDSMEPTLRSGWSVAACRIEMSDFKYIPSGIYAIVFGRYFVIKRVKNNDLMNNGTLTLHSDSEQGGTLTVPAEELRGIWRVVKVTDGPLN